MPKTCSLNTNGSSSFQLRILETYNFLNHEDREFLRQIPHTLLSVNISAWYYCLHSFTVFVWCVPINYWLSSNTQVWSGFLTFACGWMISIYSEVFASEFIEEIWLLMSKSSDTQYYIIRCERINSCRLDHFRG